MLSREMTPHEESHDEQEQNYNAGAHETPPAASIPPDVLNFRLSRCHALLFGSGRLVVIHRHELKRNASLPGMTDRAGGVFQKSELMHLAGQMH